METTQTSEQPKELFKSKLLNKLAMSSPFAAFVFYPLAGLAMLLLGIYYTSVPWYLLLACAAIGTIGWTFFEYTLHRYLYHEVERLKFGKRFQYIFHGIHHDQPTREDKLIMPPAPWLIVLGIFFVLFYVPFGAYAFGIVPGLVWGYVYYTYIHFCIHRKSPPKWMKNNLIHHQLHHHRYDNKAFGVTTPFWDRVFGTMPPEKIGWNEGK